MVQLRHCIDPTVDWVFKVLFGSPTHTDILLDFLNSILRPAVPIRTVKLLNPYSEREFKKDKLTIVDVKAMDEHGYTYQIEVQLSMFGALPARILYTGADIYRAQLKQGETFAVLKPVISIWVLVGALFPESPLVHHCFQLQDVRPTADGLNRVVLSPHLTIHTLELAKWRHPGQPLDEESRWIYFLKEARNWRQLPSELDSGIMQKVMTIMEQFSEKERNYHKYQARINYLRQQRDIEMERDQAQALKEKALQERMLALQEKDAALQEKDAALQEKDVALQEKDVALQEKDAALQEKDVALQEKDAALREIGQERAAKEKAEAEVQALRALLASVGVAPVSR